MFTAQRPTPIARPTSKASSGFTLIELMVVLLILGILGALVVPRLMDRADDARVTAAEPAPALTPWTPHGSPPGCSWLWWRA